MQSAVPGHFIQHCPTNGDPNYDMNREKPPTGIPKSMLIATPDGSYDLPSGAVAVLKPNEAAFEKDIEGLPTTHPVCDLPPQLHCPLCKEVMKDAVLTSKCCFSSFCNKCKVLVHPIEPKASSHTLSAVSKDMPKHPDTKQSPHMINGEIASEIKTGISELNPADKQAAANVNVSEAAPESLIKGPKSPVHASVMQDVVQEKQIPREQGKRKKKKKKKAGIPITAADTRCQGYQDLGAENFGMSLAASGYNPYWGRWNSIRS